MCRSKEGPKGPWVTDPNNPLCHNGVNDEVQNVGHADLVEDLDGNWWALLLGVRPVKGNNGTWQPSVFGKSTHFGHTHLKIFNLIVFQGRETFLVSVDWVDDWPVFNNGQKITLQSSSQTQLHEQIPEIWTEEFSNPNLQLGWYRKSKPTVSLHNQKYERTLRLTSASRHTAETRLFLDRPTRPSSTIWWPIHTP